MRHATNAGLAELEPLLVRLRSIPGLIEKKRGIFYRRSKASLHFHEDLTRLHADVRLDAEFERFLVQTPEEQDALLAHIRSDDAQDRGTS